MALASAPAAKTRAFASKHAQRRHPPQYVPCTHCCACCWCWASAMGVCCPQQGHFMPQQEARSKEKSTRPSTRASQLLQACYWALGVLVGGGGRGGRAWLGQGVQVEVFIGCQLEQKKYRRAQIANEPQIVDMQDCISTFEGAVKLLQEIKVDQRGATIALQNRFAMEHGRTRTVNCSSSRTIFWWEEVVRLCFWSGKYLGSTSAATTINSPPASAIPTRYRAGAWDLALRASGSHLCIILPSGTAGSAIVDMQDPISHHAVRLI
jgi:hypothetical protein